VTKAKKEVSFFTIPEYEQWKRETDDGRGWKIKYFKGLGTSDARDAQKYFGDMAKHRLPFGKLTNDDRALIDMAFNKKKADDRKEWLRGFVVRPLSSRSSACARRRADSVPPPRPPSSPALLALASRRSQPGTYMDHNVDEVPISDFINKELILFSMADNVRSIPSVVDGFKPGQRKVLFACFKRKLKNEIKVRPLAPMVVSLAERRRT